MAHVIYNGRIPHLIKSDRIPNLGLFPGGGSLGRIEDLDGEAEIMCVDIFNQLAIDYEILKMLGEVATLHGGNRSAVVV